MAARLRLRLAARTARRLVRGNSAKCGVSRPSGPKSSAGCAVASELPLKADLSFLVTDPVGARSLRLRAFPLARGGFCRCMELFVEPVLRGLIESHLLPCRRGGADVV